MFVKFPKSQSVLHRTFKRIFFDRVWGLFLICLPIAAPVSTTAQETPVSLDEMAASARQIKARETHLYSFAINAADIIFFQLEKKDLRLKISISDSQQKMLRQVTLQQFGTAAFSFIA